MTIDGSRTGDVSHLLSEVGWQRKLAAKLAASTLVVGLVHPMLVRLQAQYDSTPGTQADIRFAWPYFALLVAHALLYLVSERVRGRIWATVYFVSQSAIVVMLSSVAGPSVTIAFLTVALVLHAISRMPRQWPLWVAVGGSLAVALLSGGLHSPAQLGSVVSLIALLVLSLYLVYSVRSQLMRREVLALLREVRHSSTQLAEFASDIEQEALLTERQRMARELHDTLAQGLVGVTLQLEAVDAHLADGVTLRAREIVRHAMVQARETLMDSRRAIDNLRSEPNADTNVDEAIGREVARFAIATGLECSFTCGVGSVPPEQLVVVRRMTAECLTNVARHAHAGRVWIEVTATDGVVEVTVRDDGVGFDVSRESESGHYGILGLRERARMLGGSVRVDSTVGEGATVQFAIPASPVTINDCEDD